VAIKGNKQYMVRTTFLSSRITFATVITSIRIFLVPVIIACMAYGWWRSACILFICAAASDVLDGMVARWRNEQTFLGACLDPIADKLLLVSMFATLAFVPTPLFIIPRWFFVIILVREIIILSGFAFLYVQGITLRIQPTMLGKLTTLVEAIFIMWVFACYFYTWMPIKTYYIMLMLMLCMALSSLLQYCRIGFHSYVTR
jgi:cardiolipin synthase